MPAVMKTLGPSRSYSPHPVEHVAEVDQAGQTRQLPLVAAQQKILRNVLAGQDHRRRVQRNERRRVAKQIVEPVEKFLRQPEALVPGAASRRFARDERRPARLDRPTSSPTGTRCTSAMVSPICPSTRSFWSSGKDRPGLRADDARQPRDDEIGPLVALAFEHDFRNRHGKPTAKLRQRGPLRDELMRAAAAEKSSGSAGRRARRRDWCRSKTDADRRAAGHGCARCRAPPAGIATDRRARR